VDLEARTVVVIDGTPHRLHPVAIAEERRDIADAQFVRTRRRGAVSALARRRRRFRRRPGAPAFQHGSVVGTRRARNDAGDAQQRLCAQRRLAAVEDAAIAFDGFIDLAELEQRLAQVEPPVREIGPQRDGPAQTSRGLAIGLATQLDAAEPVPGVGHGLVERERPAIFRGGGVKLPVGMESIGVARRQGGVIGMPHRRGREGVARLGVGTLGKTRRRPGEDRRRLVVVGRRHVSRSSGPRRTVIVAASPRILTGVSPAMRAPGVATTAAFRASRSEVSSTARQPSGRPRRSNSRRMS
jgi:hypothetical protein